MTLTEGDDDVNEAVTNSPNEDEAANVADSGPVDDIMMEKADDDVNETGIFSPNEDFKTFKSVNDVDEGEVPRDFDFHATDGDDDIDDEGSVNYYDELKEHIKLMLVGLALVIGCLGFAGYNEFRNAITLKTIRAGQKHIVPTSCSPIDPSLDGDLIHVTCAVSELKSLGDNVEEVKLIPASERIALSLTSDIEVYQWIEKRVSRNSGGSTRTDWKYDREFSSEMPADSIKFKSGGKICKRKNFGIPCVNWYPQDESWWNETNYELGKVVLDSSNDSKVGDFHLPDDIISTFGTPTQVQPICPFSDKSNTTTIDTNMTSDNNTSSSYEICGVLPGEPIITSNGQIEWLRADTNGNIIPWLRQTLTVRNASIISVVAEQTLSSTFTEWVSPYHDDYGLYLFVDGNLTSIEMFTIELDENENITYLYRVGTLVAVIAGLYLITRPLVTLPKLIPFVGTYVSEMTGCLLIVVDSLIGFFCWAAIVSLMWLIYRGPIIGLPLLIFACCCCGAAKYFAIYKRNEKHAKKKDYDHGIKHEI